MMRDRNAEPPPKGKVRQLYPPPEIDDDVVSAAPSEPERTALDSMFVSDAQDLDERRRLARERAERRRSGEESPGFRDTLSDEGGAETGNSKLIRPPFGADFDEDEE